MSCAGCVRVCLERGGEQEEGDLEAPHHAIVVSPGAPVGLSARWCTRTSCNTHAIVLFGPSRAFSSVGYQHAD